MTDEELRRAAERIVMSKESGFSLWPGTGHEAELAYDAEAEAVAGRLLELLPPAGGIPTDIRADAEHVAGCSENWCHTADEADLFEAVRRAQRVAAAWLRGNQ